MFYVGILFFVCAARSAVLIPEETVGRKILTFAPEELYRARDNTQLPIYSPGRSFGTSYSPGLAYNGRPTAHQVAAMDREIKYQLAALEKNIAAARPYLSEHPQILHETEEQLRALQHINANRLLRKIESIRHLELQQEILISKVNAQLEKSVGQLKHLAVLQQKISNKQKSVQAAPIELPRSTIEASQHLTDQIHALETAKAEDQVVREIAREVVDHEITLATDHGEGADPRMVIQDDSRPMLSTIESSGSKHDEEEEKPILFSDGSGP